MNRIIRIAAGLCTLPLLISTTAAGGYGQGTERLSQVRKVYVDSLGTDRGAADMREQMVRRLRRSHEIEVVSESKDADAVIRGTGRTWITGHVSASPRSHRLVEPAFGGFLSVEVIGKNGDTLWSYLVTPSNLTWNSISDDLARQMTDKLLASIRGEGKQEVATADQVTQLEGTLKGGGATFPAPLYQRWFELFQEHYPNSHISYDAVGSGEGIERLRSRELDFGASEMPLSDEVMAEAHQRFIHVPTVLGAVVIIYNVTDLHQTLKFTPDILSGIFLGKIHKWNDPLIRKANRGVALPEVDIVVVHRSDGSGTSFVWTDYLSKVSPQWKSSVGASTSVQWPVGIGAERNEGVASTVQRTANSIGYVEFIYALQHELSFGAVRNAAGQFIQASIASVTAAAASSDSSGQDFRVSITDAPGKAAYPIATYTWQLLPEQIDDKNKKALLGELLRWELTSGQKKCSALGYAPLPAQIAQHALDSLNQVK